MSVDPELIAAARAEVDGALTVHSARIRAAEDALAEWKAVPTWRIFKERKARKKVDRAFDIMERKPS